MFEDSIIKNRAALGKFVAGAQFKSFAFPLSSPKPTNKRAAARHFLCCRGGGQTLNVGTVDLNQMSAYFLEKAKDDIQTVKDLIERNKSAKGWLIFATHDVSATPSPYGCRAEFFENVVQYARESGARILPVVKALDVVRAPEAAA